MSYCVETLKETFASRQRVNSSYSLRAFARDLQMNPGSLSSILKGQRRVPTSMGEELAAKLRLPPQQRQKFMKSIARNAGAEAAYESATVILEQDELHYRIIAEWEHYAVLNLLTTEDFRNDAEWIAQRLAISPTRAELVVKHLLQAGLVEQDAQGDLLRTQVSVRTTDDVRSLALRQAHLEEIGLATNKYDLISTAQRDYSSVTVAADPRKLPEAKALIRRFRTEMAALLADGPQTEVYQMCIQLFPLTNVPSEARKDS